MSAIRQKRTASQIQLIISDMLRREIRDPRLQMITITAVRIDRELQYADVYVNAFGEDTRQKEILEGLTQATGFFRREIGQVMRLRTVPNLHFRWDPTLAQAETIHAIFENLEIPPAPIELEDDGDEDDDVEFDDDDDDDYDEFDDEDEDE